jgi:hypothetical protein
MNYLSKIKALFLGPPVWEMDKDFKVEWQTNYSDNCGESLEQQLSLFNHKLSIFSLTSEVHIRAFLKKKFGIKSNKAYVDKLQELIEEEIESYMLGAPRNTELAKQIQNIKFLGSRYNPSYDHEAYIKAAKQRRITK